jgi:hypothetical protein
MAEVFRIQAGEGRRSGGGSSIQNGRDGRDVLYDYAEAEALWNESDTTAPGPGGALPRAAFQSPVNGEGDGDEALAAIEASRMQRKGLIRSRLLLATAGIVVASVSYWWGAASRLPVALWPPLSTAGSATAPLPSPSPVIAGANPAAMALPLIAPIPPAAPEPPALAAVVVETGENGRRRRGSDRRRWHRAPVVTDVSAVAEWSEATEPAPRGRRSRLRPIDVTDPFAR